MKFVQSTFLASAIFSVATDAVSVRGLFKKGHEEHTTTPVDDETDPSSAIDDAAADQSDRKLNNCWGKTTPAAKWHPTYSAGWTGGYCQYTVDCNSPGYGSELACCKAAYNGQMSGFCLSQLPNPPTMSPTETGGLDVYYPDYETAWTEAGCINRRPLPSGRPTYSTMLSCCKGAYGGQMSGKCLSNLPTPPTGSPTTTDYEADFWYPDYDTSWADAGCSNKLPLPFNNKNDRPSYSSQLACCKGAYAGQSSGKCLSQLEAAPTGSPTTSDYEADFWYPDYDTSWADAGCSNKLPLPYNNKADRPSYSSQLACCKGAYGGQTSGKCLSQLPNPPTTSPTESGGLGVYYADYGTSYTNAVCINERPLPSGRQTFPTLEACCNGEYRSQESQACMCAAKGVCHSCKCGTKAQRAAASCDASMCGDDQ